MIQRIYDKLKYEYLRAATNGSSFLKSNPSKQSLVLKYAQEDVPELFVNVMAAKLSDGTCGAKVIRVDEKTGNTTSYTTVYKPDGTAMIVESADLTRLRCGMMAALSAEFYLGRSALNSETRVGFIGNGRTNIKTAQVFFELFGIRKFVICGHPSFPARNYDKFIEYGNVEVASRDNGYEPLRKCDIVISCTNTVSECDILEYEQLKGPKLFISQDGGYIFGESFRKECGTFSDHPTQLLHAAPHEFPWDKGELSVVFPIEMLEKLPVSDKVPAVYLYGIALADVVVAIGG